MMGIHPSLTRTHTNGRRLSCQRESDAKPRPDATFGLRKTAGKPSTQSGAGGRGKPAHVSPVVHLHRRCRQ